MISFFITSACCHVDKIFDLTEGMAFLEKYKNRKSGFVKAVKEMTVVMNLTQSEIPNTRRNKNIVDKLMCIIQVYESY